MKLRSTTFLAIAAVLVLAVSASAARKERKERPADPFVSDVDDRSFTVRGTVESVRRDTVVLRIDDHGHSLAFSLGRNVSARPKAGQRVTVRYHPSGDTGQVADELIVH